MLPTKREGFEARQRDQDNSEQKILCVSLPTTVYIHVASYIYHDS